MKRTIASLATAIALALPGASALAGVRELQTDWARIMYETPADQRADAFEALAAQAESEVAAHPEDPARYIWEGIILSTWAGEKGGLGALGLVKQARAALEKALELDETALGGSAHTSLGSLYFKVPGWPIAFGNDKRAREHLQRALEIDPDGIDANFFMGEFLLEQGDEVGARRHLLAALGAPPRPERPVADAGRRQEIEALLQKLD
jgi:tetratricopeptide (TPR) repeat protein